MFLRKICYNPKHIPSFESVAKLLKSSNSKKRDVKEWLSSQNAYALHKPIRNRFPRNPHTVTNLEVVWEMDVSNLNTLLKYNDKFKYLLCVIDVFSRYAWIVSLNDNRVKSITTALTFISRQYPLLYNQTKVLNLLTRLSSST
jgi:hypothetical protein